MKKITVLFSLMTLIGLHAGPCVKNFDLDPGRTLGEATVDNDFSRSAFSMNNNCNAVAAWIRDDGTVQARIFDGSTGMWSSIESLTLAGVATYVSAYINNSGNAVVVWVDSAKGRLTGAYYDTGSGWTNFSNHIKNGVSDTISVCAVGLDSLDRIVVVWQEGAASETFANDAKVYGSYADLQGTIWKNTELSSGNKNQLYQTRQRIPFAINDMGSAVVIWEEEFVVSGKETRLTSKFYNPITKWGDAQIVASPPFVTGILNLYVSRHVSINESGNAAAIWARDKEHVVAATYNGIQWDNSEVLDTEKNDVVDISLNNNDEAIAVWRGTPSGSSNEVVRYSRTIGKIDFSATKWQEKKDIQNLNPVDLNKVRAPLFVCNNDKGDAGLVTSVSALSDSRVFTYVHSEDRWYQHARLRLPEFAGQLDCAKMAPNDLASGGFITGQAGKSAIATVCCNATLPFSEAPPFNMQGACSVNHFGLQGELFKILSWNVSPLSNVTEQRIYRENVLIDTVSPTQTSYRDRGRPAASELYGVSAVHDTDNETIQAQTSVEC